jgi:hypothetical protein
LDEQQFAYSLPHVTIKLPSAEKPGRPRFSVGGKELVVEAAAKEYLRGLGWWVVPGQEASLFLAILACNFQDSFFASVIANYVGADAPTMVARLGQLCERSLVDRRVSAEQLSAAADLLCRYYASESDHRRFRRLATEVGSLPHEEQLGLLKTYKYIGYFTKGIPDLFAIRSGEFVFVEVKSAGDALRPEQYFFAEVLLREVGKGFQVVRILDSGRDHRAALANPADARRAERGPTE